MRQEVSNGYRKTKATSLCLIKVDAIPPLGIFFMPLNVTIVAEKSVSDRDSPRLTHPI